MCFSLLQQPARAAIKRAGGRRLVFLMLVLMWAGALQAGDFEFVVIGDTRPTFESQDFRLFQALIPKINRLKPALVINLGDLIYGYGPRSKEKQWDKYQQVIKAVEAPYYQVPGNHDTHSKEARRIYGRRFGKFYESFDYQDWHFVLLDSTERQRWGYIGPDQLEWLREDLKQARGRGVFVFLHFPLWEPERVTPEYYLFWERTLHPLFKQYGVRAVFAGHYHAYGPTRVFDGIRYFITGGGGAELRPDYKRSGGEHHFVRVKVSGDSFDVRVVTGRGELTDPEADVMGGLRFAARNVSRVGVRRGDDKLKDGVKFSVLVANSYPRAMTGQASWIYDASAFSVEPGTVSLQIPPGGRQRENFVLKALSDTATLESLPRLEFKVAAGGYQHRFRREIRFLDELRTPYRRAAPVVDGDLADWEGVPRLNLGQNSRSKAALQACCDDVNLYLAVTVPSVKPAEDEDIGFRDDLQIGMARRLSDTDFGADFLRLGFACATQRVWNRTDGRKTEGLMPGVSFACRPEGEQTSFEIAVPRQLVHGLKPATEGHLVLDLSFPVPDGEAQGPEPINPQPNTFAYRVRYGNDSLIPVDFIELNLERKKR